MESIGNDERMLINYVLGDLPDDERNAVEERFFGDELFYQNLLLVEDDLIYDYFRGALGANDRRRFESRLKTSPGWRTKVEAITALMEAIDAVPGAEPVRAKPPGERSSFLTALVLPLLRSPSFGLAAAAGLLISIAGAAYFVNQTRELRSEVAVLTEERQQQTRESTSRAEQLQGRIAELEERESALGRELEREKELRAAAEKPSRIPQVGSDSAIATFMLLPGLVRDRDEPERLAIPSAIQRVRLTLDLEGDERYRTFRAELRTAGGRLLSSQPGLSTPIPGGRGVRLVLPASILSNGEYEITLLGSKGNGQFETVRYYYFQVARR